MLRFGNVFVLIYVDYKRIQLLSDTLLSYTWMRYKRMYFDDAVLRPHIHIEYDYRYKHGKKG